MLRVIVLGPTNKIMDRGLGCLLCCLPKCEWWGDLETQPWSRAQLGHHLGGILTEAWSNHGLDLLSRDTPSTTSNEYSWCKRQEPGDGPAVSEL